MKTLALVVYDDRFARLQQTLKNFFTKREFRWGLQAIFVGGEIQVAHSGVGYEAITFDLGGPIRLKHYDESRYPNQGFSCFGCPHLAVGTKYVEPHCAHPFYLEIWGCPQSVAPRDLKAPADCPMLGLRSEQAQRRYRWHVKSHKIFWRYYYDAVKNPHREGFSVYR